MYVKLNTSLFLYIMDLGVRDRRHLVVDNNGGEKEGSCIEDGEEVKK
jgi:hypothetical protein